MLRRPASVFLLSLFSLTFFFAPPALTQEEHSHTADQLGEVHFPTTCKPEVQAEFDRAVALLHSFAYTPAEEAFRGVAQKDAGCGIAHWGAAMTHLHPLWPQPIPPGEAERGRNEVAAAQRAGAGSERERKLIAAIALIFPAQPEEANTPYPARLAKYEQAMAALAAENPQDVETQVFYALALVAMAQPSDKTHAKQKQAAAILEPLYRAHPQHPGMAHYLIHAYDNAELAQRGLPIAQAYSKIAASASHALHMPSHIYTRLGMWADSIASNEAARAAARRAGDIGEELHAMDYLVYAYLQMGRDEEAAQVIAQSKAMPNLKMADFKVGYAATAMPVRYAVERRDWAGAAAVATPAGAAPQVTAIAVWSQGLGAARGEAHADAGAQAAQLQQLEEQLTAAGNAYWATQVRIMKREVMAWSALAREKDQPARAIALMREAADEEDAVEKLPVTPGPIVPAREQLGEMLLQQRQWDAAAREFKVALGNAPGRRGALTGAAEADKRRVQNGGQ
jgi:tetratricopeptide (TPR) repeat protein